MKGSINAASLSTGVSSTGDCSRQIVSNDREDRDRSQHHAGNDLRLDQTRTNRSRRDSRTHDRRVEGTEQRPATDPRARRRSRDFATRQPTEKIVLHKCAELRSVEDQVLTDYLTGRDGHGRGTGCSPSREHASNRVHASRHVVVQQLPGAERHVVDEHGTDRVRDRDRPAG